MIKNKKMIRLVLQEKKQNLIINDNNFPDKLDFITGKTFLNDVEIIRHVSLGSELLSDILSPFMKSSSLMGCLSG